MRIRLTLAWLPLLSLLAACMSTSVPRDPPPGAVAELAPKGSLPAAINYGSPVLAQKGPGYGPSPGRFGRPVARAAGVKQLMEADARRRPDVPRSRRAPGDQAGGVITMSTLHGA